MGDCRHFNCFEAAQGAEVSVRTLASLACLAPEAMKEQRPVTLRHVSFTYVDGSQQIYMYMAATQAPVNTNTYH